MFFFTKKNVRRSKPCRLLPQYESAKKMEWPGGGFLCEMGVATAIGTDSVVNMLFPPKELLENAVLF